MCDYGEKYDIKILCNRKADAFFHISNLYDNVVYPDKLGHEQVDLAYSNLQILSLRHLMLIKQHARKLVVCIQDIISLDLKELADFHDKTEALTRLSLRCCDGLICISNTVLDNVKRHFDDVFIERNFASKAIYLGADNETSLAVSDEKLPFDEYFFVCGNTYSHKNIPPTMETVKDTDTNYVFLGTEKEGYCCKNIFGLPSGYLEEERLERIKRAAIAFVFPSLIEGFGLPIMDSMRLGKKIILLNTPINREMKEAFDSPDDNFTLIDSIDELPEAAKAVAANPNAEYKNGKKLRLWPDVAAEIVAFWQVVLEQSESSLLHQKMERKEILQLAAVFVKHYEKRLVFHIKDLRK